MVGEPKVGEEWFHRETLATVTVSDVRGIADPFRNVRFIGAPATAGCVLVPNFLRDYARNEPVTRSLLESQPGWTVTPERDRISRADYKLDDEHDYCLFFNDGEWTAVVWSNKGTELYTAVPSNLRDLTNTLRVFGVQSQPRNEGSGE
jgi:hypothetical protein